MDSFEIPDIDDTDELIRIKELSNINPTKIYSPDCIRKHSNWSTPNSIFNLDKIKFLPDN